MSYVQALTRVGATGPWQQYQAVGVTVSVSGTASDGILDSEIVAGGETIILTLSGDTWAAAGTGPIGSTADTQALIDGITAIENEALGWNNEVRDKELTSAVVRTSDTVATITLSAASAYAITDTENITITIPNEVLTTTQVDLPLGTQFQATLGASTDDGDFFRRRRILMWHVKEEEERLKRERGRRQRRRRFIR